MTAGSDQTFVACLTPAGRGAIASLCLLGADAWRVIRNLWTPLPRSQITLPEEPTVGPIWLGRLGDKAQDEVVLAVKYLQPTPCVEIHCHGGGEMVRVLIETFQRHGIKECSWQELEGRAAGRSGRAAIVALLPQAPTIRTASILLDQYHGAFESSLDAIFEQWERQNHQNVRELLDGLAKYSAVGRHLTHPWQVVIAGAPNVGKSSLVNAIAGYQRCIVAPTPGTTRDLVTVVIAIDGWPIELSDTAGFRHVSEDLEQEGIAVARQAAQAADLCLWVVDSSVPPQWPDFQLPSLRMVINKIDLPPAWDMGQAGAAVQVSARTGFGIPDLCQAVAKWLVPDASSPGAAVPYSAALCSAVEAAWHHYLAGELDKSVAALRKARSQIKSVSAP
jgi:tRNA modification GTPase